MQALLDTHLLIWAVTNDPRLPATTRTLVEDNAIAVLFSAVSIWEIAIKARRRRNDFRYRPNELLRAALETGFSELKVAAAAASLVAELPLHHRDPFDRLLVAQAIHETVRLYTQDAALQPYSELVTLVP